MTETNIIKISSETRTLLNRINTKNESYDDLIKRLIIEVYDLDEVTIEQEDYYEKCMNEIKTGKYDEILHKHDAIEDIKKLLKEQ